MANRGFWAMAGAFVRVQRGGFFLAIIIGAMSAVRAGAADGFQEPPVAHPMEFGSETRETVKMSPSSTLDLKSAFTAATVLANQIKGARVFSVLATGSMRPMFDEKAFLVAEPVSFEALRVGDIVTYKHPRLHVIVVHRILEKRGDAFWSKGDYNTRMDDVYVTRENYVMRVFAIIYAREDGKSETRAAKIHANPVK